MKKFAKKDQQKLAAWAAACAKRVLPLFEKSFPNDDRPRNAIKTCRTFAKTGIFSMAIIRSVSLDAHAAARDAKENKVACFAARAAGQAVATAHVSQHAFGSPYYSLKAIAMANPKCTKEKLGKEIHWQTAHLPKNLRPDWVDFQLNRFPKNLRLLFQ